MFFDFESSKQSDHINGREAVLQILIKKEEMPLDSVNFLSRYNMITFFFKSKELNFCRFDFLVDHGAMSLLLT